MWKRTHIAKCKVVEVVAVDLRDLIELISFKVGQNTKHLDQGQPDQLSDIFLFSFRQVHAGERKLYGADNTLLCITESPVKIQYDCFHSFLYFCAKVRKIH